VNTVRKKRGKASFLFEKQYLQTVERGAAVKRGENKYRQLVCVSYFLLDLHSPKELTS
jgi:hypothetical protein